MIAIERKHLALMMEAAYIYMGMKRFKEARELFDGLKALAPESEVPEVALGNVEFCEGRLSKAIVHYRRALEMDPASVFAKVYMAEALLFSGGRDEAMGLLKEVAREDRDGAGEFATALLDAVKREIIPVPKMENRK